VTEVFSINRSKFDPILQKTVIFNVILIWDIAVAVKNEVDRRT
jgi:hypothetical protein